MCLVSVAWYPKRPIPLMVVTNRDEYYNRLTLKTQHWKDESAIFGGKDLVAGGTWCGIQTSSGRFSVVTNFRERDLKKPKRSRGFLVYDFLSAVEKPVDWLKKKHTVADQYAGFNLFVGGVKGIFYYSNRDSIIRTLEPGVHGFSNGYFDKEWPKVRQLNKDTDVISQELNDDSYILSGIEKKIDHYAEKALLCLHNDTLYLDELPGSGIPVSLEKKRSACFIAGEDYGTRLSTVIFITRTGHVFWFEQHYNSYGVPAGYYRHAFEVTMCERKLT